MPNTVPLRDRPLELKQDWGTKTCPFCKKPFTPTNYNQDVCDRGTCQTKRKKKFDLEYKKRRARLKAARIAAGNWTGRKRN